MYCILFLVYGNNYNIYTLWQEQLISENILSAIYENIRM